MAGAGGGVEGAGPAEAAGGAGGPPGGGPWGAGFAGAVPGGAGGAWGAEGGSLTVQAPSTQAQPAFPWTQWPAIHTALGEGGISQWPATQAQLWVQDDQCPAS